jgi:hypothetical protein
MLQATRAVFANSHDFPKKKQLATLGNERHYREYFAEAPRRSIVS